MSARTGQQPFRRFNQQRRNTTQVHTSFICSAQAAIPTPPAHPVPIQQLTALEAGSALHGISTVVLDCDGVLWRGNDVFEGVDAFLARMRAAGKRILFVTNNSTKTREQYVAKFLGLGLVVSSGEIVTAAYAVAEFLVEKGLPGKSLVLGTPSVREEMQGLGLETVIPEEVEYCSSTEPWDIDEFSHCTVDPSISSVVVAMQQDFSYRTLCYASACLRENPGCVLVASNPDAGDMLAAGRIMPGTGCLVAAVQMASGVEPIHVGKGGPWLLPFLCRKYSVDATEACIVGDRLDTDIALGKTGGWRTILPLTGVTSLADVLAADLLSQPDFVIAGVVDL